MAGVVLAYDADCGSCTRFKEFVDFVDLRHRIAFVSLIEADDSGLLDAIPPAERHTTFHLVLADGEVLSGAAAVIRLVGTLPGGAPFAKLLSLTPGGVRLVSVVYASFSRAHDGSACSYPRTRSRRESTARTEHLVNPRFVGYPRSRYLSAGVLGGFIGSFAMGLFVRLPDALCVALATRIAGEGLGTDLLAWLFHVVTGVLVGVLFGYVAGTMHLGGRKRYARSLVSGVLVGLFVWSAFFTPLMLYFVPSLVTQHLLDASLAAHLTLGLVLGVTLPVTLGRNP